MNEIFDQKQTLDEIELFSQFRISFAHRVTPRGFNGHWIDNLFVEVHVDLPTAEVRDSTGAIVGLIIGDLVDLDGGVIVKSLTLDRSIDGAGFWDSVERYLYYAHGNFVFLSYRSGYGRLYLDANGVLSAVYSKSKKIVASTSGLIHTREEYRNAFEREIFNRLDVMREGWFPSGLTAHKDIERLLCNHYLELPSFESKRHWPIGEFELSGCCDDDATELIERTTKAIAILARNKRLAASLTGGNESRFVLAAAKDFIGDIEFFTVATKGTQRDVVLAQRLANEFKLKHRLLLGVQASARQQRHWRFRASHSVGGGNMILHPSVWPLEEFSEKSIGGLGGEIGRAFFWRKSDRNDAKISSQSLVARFGMPISEQVVDATDKWVKNLPDVGGFTKLDLAYLELRMSAWAFAQTYTQRAVFQPIHPMISRRNYELMMRQAPEVKINNNLMWSGLSQKWPKLKEIPVNRYGNYKDYLDLMRSTLSLTRLRKVYIKKFG